MFYVGPGQEDKMSIMSNTAGSKMFEDFVSGMTWEVSVLFLSICVALKNCLEIPDE